MNIQHHDKKLKKVDVRKTLSTQSVLSSQLGFNLFNPMTLTACAMRVSWENSILVLGSNSMQKCHELGAAESKWGIGRK